MASLLGLLPSPKGQSKLGIMRLPAARDGDRRTLTIVEGLADEEAARLLAMARELRVGDERASRLDALRRIPGVTVPARWPPRFRDAEPAVVSGRPASEMLAEDRR